MIPNSVCAVFVIYNCGEAFIENFYSVYEQVETVIIVDNGDGHQIKELQTTLHNNFIGILNNNENGIAGALNKGLDFAYNNGYKYILTMDQDSLLEKNGVNKMLDLLKKYNLNSCGPNLSNKISDSEIISQTFLITSGNLVETNAAKAVGGYDNELFIDSVDLDFCLKLRLAGFRFGVARDVFMKHALGEPITGKFLFFSKEISYHNPFRQYYIFRNLYIMRRRYKKHDRKLCLKLCIAQICKKLEIRLFYPKESKKEILKQIKKGKQDAGKLGKK